MLDLVWFVCFDIGLYVVLLGLFCFVCFDLFLSLGLDVGCIRFVVSLVWGFLMLGLSGVSGFACFVCWVDCCLVVWYCLFAWLVVELVTSECWLVIVLFMVLVLLCIFCFCF